MRPSPRLFRLLVLAFVGTALAGCISLFPKQKPLQLYEFGETAGAAAPAAPAAGPGFVVILANTDFDRAAAGERILTIQGDQTAYIEGAGWVSPAPMLFDLAIRKAFDAGPARLLAKGEPARADYSLTLDVRTFEARYLAGPNAPPTVRIEVYAGMGATSERTDHDRVFVGEAAASDNRVSAIVIAFDQAFAKVMAQLVPWVDARGQG
jgi:cholesterol transport system auxiliary component